MIQKLRISFWVFVFSALILFASIVALLLGYLGIANYLALFLILPLLYGGYYVSPFIVGLLVVDIIFNRYLDKTSFILALILNIIFFFVSMYGLNHLYDGITMML